LKTGGLLPPEPSDDADRTPGGAFCAQPVNSDAAMAATASILLELPLHCRSLQSITIRRYRFIFTPDNASLATDRRRIVQSDFINAPGI
jgi:hypothetical protein